jgi:arylsulfatase A-like enzyme
MGQPKATSQVCRRPSPPTHSRSRATVCSVWIFLAIIAQIFCATKLMADSNDRPNVLVIMTDDLGFSDVGCYGSEIETPNLDRLATGGLRFSQFYNTAKCHSSRISLLTGQYAFQAGNTALSRAVTSAEVLSQAGYFSAMVGKWHLKQEPTDFGFERYFGHLSGACNYFTGDNTFRLNGKPWQVPGEGFYTTVANVDYAIRFLGEARHSSDPWYLYVAFNAPHAPLHPLKEDYEKYRGRYDVGWDVIRGARINKQLELGLFGGELHPSPRPDHVPAWSGLSEERRGWESRRMAAYAGMIDRVDQEVGRLLNNVEAAGELDNTFILFVSDNGACPYDRRHTGIDKEPFVADTRWSDSTGWAWARNSPFRFYKQNQFEGGIATPGIVHWPAGLKTKTGSINHDPVHLIDVLPTVAELAGATIPKQWPGRDLQPLSGVSFARVLRGQPAEERPPIHLLFSNDRGLRDGQWKLTSFRGGAWELYHLPSDRTELHDVAAENPDVRDRMIRTWHEMAKSVLHAPASALRPVTTVTEKKHPEWTDFSKEPAETAIKSTKKSQRSPATRGNFRARVDTSVDVTADELVLHCRGTDSGVAMDRLALPPGTAGPYELKFQLSSQAGGSGEVFFTTDAKSKLPAGQHVEFEVMHDGRWHEHSLPLQTAKTLFALRFDPCSEPGIVRVRSLRLTDAAGVTLQRWPAR